MKKYLKYLILGVLGIIALSSVANAAINIVPNGGTGVGTITGLIKGNGTSPFTVASAGTDYQAPITLTVTGNSGASTFTANTLNIPTYTANGLLPSQTSNSGKFLTTDGSNTSWATVSSGGSGTVTSVASADGSITVTNPTTTVDLAVVKAPKWTTGRTLSISGDLTYTSPSFDGSGNVTAAGTLATVNSNVGTFGSATQSLTITANAKGLITAISAQTVTPAVSSITGLGTGIATWLATPSSANLLSAQTDKTGSGLLVFGTSPTLTTAVLGSSTATTQTQGDNSTKLATTAYVDLASLGQNFKEAARVTTTANLVGTYLSGVFTYTATGTDAIDGVTLALNDRVLVKNQTTDFQNGIYKVTTAGAIGVAGVLTRSTDANASIEFKTGDSIFITSGTANSTTTWAYTGANSPTLGTDSITYAQVAGQGSFTSGNGITITGNSIAINTAVTVDKTTAQTLTNKNFTDSTNILGGVTTTLGSDATGDIYYRNSGGIFTRLGIGSTGQALTVSGGLPSWSGLANLTATDSTLTFSGTYTGVTARTIGLNLGNANTWTGVQQFGTIGGAVGKFVLAGSTSGSSILNAAAVAGTTTLTLPGTTGTLALNNQATDTFGATTDVTTNNATTLAHGFLPKLDNTVTHFLNGQGGWTTPPGATVDKQTFTASGTWNKPAGATVTCVEAWGGGGSGGNRTTSTAASGGGGGGYTEKCFPTSSLGSSETITVAPGGTAVTGNSNGNPGGDSSFGSWLTAYGGGAGFGNSGTAFGGGGGGPLGSGNAGNTTAQSGGTPGAPFSGTSTSSTNASAAIYGGGGGGGTNVPAAGQGGNSQFGGGGGGGSANNGSGAAASGGTSMFAGSGGIGGAPGIQFATSGNAPGGGGGGSTGNSGNAGAGARGEIRVYSW